MFYNTTGERNYALIRSHEKADIQEVVVLRFFLRHPSSLFSPEEVHADTLAASGAPLTSTRRAITNLAGRGFLVKTGTMRTGSYGKVSHTWRYNRGARSFPPPVADGDQE